MAAERIFINGNIYTVNNEKPYAEAMAVSGQDLIYVGDTAGAMALVGPGTEVVDLEGKTVLPGLIENHIHPIQVGVLMEEVDADKKSKEDILAFVKAKAEEIPEGGFIGGFGWNQELWEDNQFPSKEDLDSVAPNHYVVLARTCGHAYWLNSKAMEKAGITEDIQNPVGGEFVRKPDGTLLGVLTDTACEWVQGIMPEYTVEDIKRITLKVQDRLVSFGMVGASDMGVLNSVYESRLNITVKAMEELHAEDKLKVRSYLYVVPGEELEEAYARGPQIGLLDDRLTIRGQKLFADGALGARSAWLLDDYCDRPGHCGNGRLADDELYGYLKRAQDHGFQTTCHCIGDAAVKQMLDACEKLGLEDRDDRMRIEHFMIVREEDFARMGRMKMVTSMQFVELSSDLNMVEDRIGKERVKGAYAWRKILNAGGVIAAGSDHPIDNMNPFESLYFAVSRCSIHEEPKGGYYPEQALTRYEALKAYTLDGAYARFEEKRTGSLEVGKHADFIVIDRDYFECPLKEIKDIKVLRTVIGGETVYQK